MVFYSISLISNIMMLMSYDVSPGSTLLHTSNTNDYKNLMLMPIGIGTHR